VAKEIKTISENLTALEYYYYKQDAATRECLLALKFIVLSIDKNIIHKRKYQIPFFCYNEFNLDFLWVHKKKILFGFIEDKKSFQRIKDSVTTLEINPLDDIPVDEIKHTFGQLITKYKH
jgi:hypothetical protein